MNDDANSPKTDKNEAETLGLRFPEMPKPPEIPEAPRLEVLLPPHPEKPRPDAIEPGSYQKAALGYTAASAFITPVLVLSVGGYFLDGKLHHQTQWFAMVGLILGLIVGVSALLRVVNKLNE